MFAPAKSRVVFAQEFDEDSSVECIGCDVGNDEEITFYFELFYTSNIPPKGSSIHISFGYEIGSCEFIA